MCGRFIAKTDQNWQNFFTLKKPPPPFESYNIAPSQSIPVVRRVEAGNECELFRWGLIPFFARGVPGQYSTINARIETLATSPAYRGPWKRAQRCIIPANGFYEWQQLDDRKQPYFIQIRGRELFGFAGLWDRSVSETGEAIHSCTIITQPASPFMATIHNSRQREPAILQPADHEVWLAGDSAAAHAALRPAAEGMLQAHAVSTRVNSPRNHGPELMRPESMRPESMREATPGGVQDADT
jgi:putative SOS response-associated peptidase YedK